MSRFDTGTTDVPSAGTRVQISNTLDRVQWIRVSARTGISGALYFGRSDVAAANGYELSANDHLEIDFRPGSEAFSAFYVDASTNGNDLDWAVILEH
tara:strand:- start:33 stop:323 length:291 start_codon:yes stop_codon:yes gene_type:complete